jgi:peptidoglycan/LPS O-acetylase OafA/YrhL
MRGIAALLVVFTHAVDLATRQGGSAGRTALEELGNLQNFGAIGVDLFFVVSGFVMALSTRGLAGTSGAARFLALRWIRIAPPYLVATVVFAGVLYAADGATFAVANLWNAFGFVPILDNVAYSEPPLSIGWTLSFEVSFYLLTAVTVLVAGRVRALVLLLLMTGAGLVGVFASPQPFILNWLTNPIYLEFAIGVGAYLLWDRGWVVKARPMWLVFGAVGAAVLLAELVVGFGDISEAERVLDASLSAERVLLWGLPVGAIFIALLPASTSPSSAIGRLLRALGDASYSIYLVHLLVFIALQAALNRMPFSPAAGLIITIGIGGGIVAGMAFFSLVERPLTERLRRAFFGDGDRASSSAEP